MSGGVITINPHKNINTTTEHTVDGRNPAPVGRWFIAL
jgi:hypothetical protein